MEDISKEIFLKKFGDQFEGTDENGYRHKGTFITQFEIKFATHGIAKSIDDVEYIIDNYDHTSDLFGELNNAIMSYIFGDGDEFQGLYLDERGSNQYEWYLDFGKIDIDRIKIGINYYDAKFYKG